MTWHRIELSAEASAKELAEAIRSSFDAAFTAAGKPRNAALFEINDSSFVHFYLSPGGADLLDAKLKLVARKSPGAPPAEARLVVGDPDTWRRA